MSHTVHEEAEAELNAAAAFYRHCGVAALAESLIAEFGRVVSSLASSPDIGTPLDDNLRIFPLRRFPYSLVYFAVGNDIQILVFAHPHRRPGYWRGRN